MKSSTKRRKLINGNPVPKNIPLAEISADETESPAPTDEDTDEEYAELADDGCAALSRELIVCEVHQGGFRDALKFSLKANAAHGLRRTNEDKRNAVAIALDDEEWGQWSLGAIAELCGVSKNFVGTQRMEREESELSSEDTSQPNRPNTRIGKDSKRYPATKKRRAAENQGVTSTDPVKTKAASNGQGPNKNGAPVVTEKDRRIALKLLADLRMAMDVLSLLDDKYCAYLKEMTVSVEEL